jgi:predicted transcriptional regulator
LPEVQVTWEEALTLALGLGPLEVEIYRMLMSRGATRAGALCESLHREMSTVHRSLHKAMAAGVVLREKKTYRRGGYYYVYDAVEREKVAKRAREAIAVWQKGAGAALEKFSKG